MKTGKLSLNGEFTVTVSGFGWARARGFNHPQDSWGAKGREGNSDVREEERLGSDCQSPGNQI